MQQRILMNTTRYCFLETAKEMKHLEEIEFAILAKWFQYLECEPRTRLDLIGNKFVIQIQTVLVTVFFSNKCSLSPNIS